MSIEKPKQPETVSVNIKLDKVLDDFIRSKFNRKHGDYSKAINRGLWMTYGAEIPAPTPQPQTTTNP